jgi:hypothetical protein
MNPRLEELLKAYDAFRQAGEGSESTRLHAFYDALLENTAEMIKVPKATLHGVVTRHHPRWVRARKKSEIRPQQDSSPVQRRAAEPATNSSTASRNASGFSVCSKCRARGMVWIWA